MSTAMARTATGTAAREAGTSLLEVIITMGLTITMVFVVTTLCISGNDAQKYAERINRVTEITQEIVEEMRGDLVSSVRVFANDATGTAYRALLVRAGLPTPLNSRLPTLDPTGTFKRDTVGSEKTGNVLLFARHAWTDRFRCAGTGNEYHTDVYRIVEYYLSREGSGPRAGTNTGLNLCKFVGEPMADGQQLDQIVDAADQAEVLAHLVGGTPDVDGTSRPRVELAWVLGPDPLAAGTLRQILPAGTMVAAPQAPRANVWQVVADARLSQAGLLGYRHFSVATNYARSAMGVGRFGLATLTGDGFPHGFELQLIGPSSARQVLLHLSLVSANRKGHQAYAEHQSICDGRDI
jgi:hypothetical protein